MVGESEVMPDDLIFLPEAYDATEVGAALRSVDQALPAAAPPIAAAIPVEDRARRLALAYQGVGGLLGTAQDRRVARVARVVGSGLDGREQRFRLEPGTLAVPLAKAPIDRGTTGATDLRVMFGALCVGIPHDLGRPPEFVLARTSVGARGPQGQEVRIAGGTVAASLSGAFSSDDEVRCDFDFVPVLGVERQDIERQLKFVFGVTDGLTTVGPFDWGDDPAGTGSDFEAPALPVSVAAEMVTTATTFSGLLVATAWGHGTFRGGDADWNGAALNVRSVTHQLQNPLSLHPDAMASMALPGVGKSPWWMQVPKWAGTPTLQQILDDGLVLRLARGSVDFIMR